MADRVPVYYWDTCLFLEHFRNEVVAPAKKRAITRILSENKAKQNRIVTSVLTHTEAIPRKLFADDEPKEALYWSYFNGVFLMDAEISRPIVNLSREIRDFYFKEADAKTGTHHRMLGLGDAIHIASAIVLGVDEFHTRDKKSRGGNIGLLDLCSLTANGKIANRWQLKILSPEDTQGDLLDPLAPPAPKTPSSPPETSASDLSKPPAPSVPTKTKPPSKPD
jgi:predicted nucleic acid-binding protein